MNNIYLALLNTKFIGWSSSIWRSQWSDSRKPSENFSDYYIDMRSYDAYPKTILHLVIPEGYMSQIDENEVLMLALTFYFTYK